MMDKIFDLIMKEARSRPGPDLTSNIFTVLSEIDTKVMAILDQLHQDERRKEQHES